MSVKWSAGKCVGLYSTVVLGGREMMVCCTLKLLSPSNYDPRHPPLPSLNNEHTSTCNKGWGGHGAEREGAHEVEVEEVCHDSNAGHGHRDGRKQPKHRLDSNQHLPSPTQTENACGEDQREQR